MTKKIYGYVRVSTKEQNPKRQIQNLKEYGIDERDIIIDTCTGTNFRRSGYSALEKVLLEEGDELVILSIDRLGRNKNATKREYNKLINKGVKLTFLEDPKLNSDVYNEEELDVKTYIAEQECKMIKKRSKQGIDAMPADKNGRKYSSKTGNYIGRPSAKYPNNFTEVYNKWKEEEISANDAIKMCGISKGTFYKLVHKYEEENKIV